MQQDVAILAGFKQGRSWSGIAGDYDHTIRSFESEAEGLSGVAMIDRKGIDLDTFILINSRFRDINSKGIACKTGVPPPA